MTSLRRAAVSADRGRKDHRCDRLFRVPGAPVRRMRSCARRPRPALITGASKLNLADTTPGAVSDTDHEPAPPRRALKGYGCLVDDPKTFPIEIVRVDPRRGGAQSTRIPALDGGWPASPGSAFIVRFIGVGCTRDTSGSCGVRD